VSKLAARYTNASLGTMTIKTDGATTTLDVGEWKSAIGTRKNDDGTYSIVLLDPGIVGFEATIGAQDGKRTLVIRDAQHEYVLVEAP
jgi:hypothetical protein